MFTELFEQLLADGRMRVVHEDEERRVIRLVDPDQVDRDKPDEYIDPVLGPKSNWSWLCYSSK